MHRSAPKTSKKITKPTIAKPLKLKKTVKKLSTSRIHTSTTLSTTSIANHKNVPLTFQSASIFTTIKKVQKNKRSITHLQLRKFASMPPSGLILELPALSPTMETGGLSKWHVKQGDLIRPGDLIADIETDKAVVGFESQDEYFLAAILMAPGTSNLPVGTPLGITVEEEGDIPAAIEYAKMLQSGGSATPAKAPATPQETSSASPSSSPKATTTGVAPKKIPKPISAAEMTLPALSPTMEMGKLVKWHFKEGDLIKPGDLIADIQTDKATVGFESQDEYYLAKILIPEGSESINVNSLIAATAEDESEIKATREWAISLGVAEESPVASPSKADEAPKTVEAPKAQAATSQAKSNDGKAGPYKHRGFGPAVQGLIHQHHIDPSHIQPTGGFGYLTKTDVLAAIESGNIVTSNTASSVSQTETSTKSKPTCVAAPKPTQDPSSQGFNARRRRARTFVDVPVTPATTQSGKDIVESKQTPQHTQNGVVSLSNLSSFVNTFATESDVNSALVSIIAKAINNNLKGSRGASGVENDLIVHDRATGGKYLLSRQVATQIGQNFKRSKSFANTDDTNAVYNIHLFTNVSAPTLVAAEPVPKHGALSITVGVPQSLAAATETGIGLDSQVTVTVVANNNKIDELVSASIMKDIKSLAKDPIMMLL